MEDTMSGHVVNACVRIDSPL